MKALLTTAAIGLLATTACGPETATAPLVDDAASTELDPAVKARIAEIEKLDDADVLYEIVRKDTMFSDTGKAADKRLIEVMRSKIATASSRDLYELKQKYDPLPGSKLYDAFNERGKELAE